MSEQSSSNEPSKSPDKPVADPAKERQRLSIWQMIGSTIAAAFGVQSSKNRERDFSQGKALPFIFMGIAFTVLFVLAVVGVVNLALP